MSKSPPASSSPESSGISSSLVSFTPLATLGSFGAMASLALPLYFFQPEGLYLFASLGSTACIVYAAPESPFSRPRSIIGGHMVSASAGIAVAAAASMIELPPTLAAPFAVAAAVSAMLSLRCLHPPAAGTSLIALTTTLPSITLLSFLGIQTFAIVLVAAIFGRVFETHAALANPLFLIPEKLPLSVTGSSAAPAEREFINIKDEDK